MNRYLSKGQTLQFSEGMPIFTIEEIIGTGASCVVYRASASDGTEHLLKEYNPKLLSVSRTKNGDLILDSEEDSTSFSEGLERFRSGFYRQTEIRKFTELRNVTSNAQGLYEKNQTAYIDMPPFTGETLGHHHFLSLYDLVRCFRAIAHVVGHYHKKGFLHLDIKPDNIFVLPETPEMIMLFDFDSVTPKNDIRFKKVLSYTKSWAAPEQILPGRTHKICEATDLYAIGEMLFFFLFERHSLPEERRSFSQFAFDGSQPLLEGIDQPALDLLKNILIHTIANTVSLRYAGAQQLILQLNELAELINPNKPKITDTIPAAQPFFVGREPQLLAMERQLQENRILFLSGIGGIGKTELAKNYALSRKAQYKNILYAVCSDSLAQTISDDSAIAISNFVMQPDESISAYVQRKLRKLKELLTGEELLVIDNLSDLTDPLLQQVLSLNCTILLTTRANAEEFGYAALQVDTLDSREHIRTIFDQYYTRPLSADDYAVTEDIIDYVDGHTMAVELIAKQMMSGRIRAQEMLHRLQGGLNAIGKDKIMIGKDNNSVKKSAYDHIQTLFDLSDLNEESLTVLMELSLIPKSGIDTELFKQWSGLEDFEILNSLCESGWTRLSEAEDIISVHPIIADLAIKRMNGTAKPCERLLQGILDFVKDDAFDTMEAIEREKQIPVLIGVASLLYKEGFADPIVADVLYMITDKITGFRNIEVLLPWAKRALEIRQQHFGDQAVCVAVSSLQLASLLRKEGKFEESEDFSKKALEIYKAQSPKNPIDIADALENLGNLYSEIGDLEKAKSCLLNALEILEDASDESDTMASVLGSLADYEKKTDQFYDAEQHYSRSLAIRMKLHGERNGKTADSYNSLGTLYRPQGKLGLAEENYRKALDICKDIYGERYRDTAICYTNLGSLYQDQGKLGLAEEYYRKALSIRKDIYGERNSDIATSFTHLGNLYKAKGNLDLAEEYYRKALSIRKDIYGERHSDIATSYSNIGSLYEEQGKLDKAEENYRKALFIHKDIYGDRNGKTARSYSNLGSLYQCQGKLGKAEEYYRKALSIRKDIYGERHSATAESYNSLGVLYRTQGKLDKAEEYYREALSIRKDIYGERYSDTATSYQNLGVLYRAQGKFDLAEECLQKAFEIDVSLYGIESPQVAFSYSALGQCALMTQNWPVAEENLKKALDIRKRLYGDDFPLTAKSIERLGNFYTETEDYASAEGYHRRALTIRQAILGEIHKDTADSYHCLGVLFERQKQDDLAATYFQKEKEICQKLHPIE